jgi:hypothetical protein
MLNVAVDRSAEGVERYFDRELFSKRNQLIDTLSEERDLTPEEEKRIAQQERDSKTTKLFSGKAEIENWRQQMGPDRWDSITPEAAKEVLNSTC